MENYFKKIKHMLIEEAESWESQKLPSVKEWIWFFISLVFVGIIIFMIIK